MATAPSDLMLQVIGRIPLFKGFSPTQVRLVLGMCDHRVCPPGQELCTHDAAAEWIFILVAGELERVKPDGAVVERVVPVTTVGEAQVMMGQPYPCSVRVTKQSHVFQIPRFQFERMLRRDAEAQLRAYKNVAEELAKQSDQDAVSAQVTGLEQVNRRQEARIAALERQVRQQGQKLEAALELLSLRADMSRTEAEGHIVDRLQGRVPRVLIVDDEPEFRRFVREALGAFMVVEAASSREALDIVQEEQLDLIIADIRMPEMDGCTLLANLRSRFPGMPVLAVSGYLGADDLQSYGFDGFVDKPVLPQDLQDKVEATLGRMN